jgi:hypothetical protein
LVLASGPWQTVAHSLKTGVPSEQVPMDDCASAGATSPRQHSTVHERIHVVLVMVWTPCPEREDHRLAHLVEESSSGFLARWPAPADMFHAPDFPLSARRRMK